MMVSRRKKRRNLRPKRFAKYETNTYRLVQLVSVGLAVDLFSLFLVIGHELYDLWNEYENSLSNEAIFVKEVDKLEMLIQAFEYERDDMQVRAKIWVIFSILVPAVFVMRIS